MYATDMSKIMKYGYGNEVSLIVINFEAKHAQIESIVTRKGH